MNILNLISIGVPKSINYYENPSTIRHYGSNVWRLATPVDGGP